MSIQFVTGADDRTFFEGVIVAIDTFLGSPEHWNHADENANLILWKHGRPLLYEQFLTNVVRTGFQDLIVPLAQTSENAAAILSRLGISASLIHIDAAHEYEAVIRDTRLYWDLLEPGGYLIGDDYHPTWPGVVRAADEFAKSIQQPLQIVAPKWILKKQQRMASSWLHDPAHQLDPVRTRRRLIHIKHEGDVGPRLRRKPGFVESDLISQRQEFHRIGA